MRINFSCKAAFRFWISSFDCEPFDSFLTSAFCEGGGGDWACWRVSVWTFSWRTVIEAVKSAIDASDSFNIWFATDKSWLALSKSAARRMFRSSTTCILTFKSKYSFSASSLWAFKDEISAADRVLISARFSFVVSRRLSRIFLWQASSLIILSFCSSSWFSFSALSLDSAREVCNWTTWKS